MPKYLDELPELLFIPIDVIGVFFIGFLPFNFINQLLGLICGVAVGFWYHRSKKGKPRNYWMLLIYRLGFKKIKGAPAPTVKEFTW